MRNTANQDGGIAPGQHPRVTFRAAQADAVALIHEHGRALGPGGRPVPIVVHELEYFPEIAAQNDGEPRWSAP